MKIKVLTKRTTVSEFVIEVPDGTKLSAVRAGVLDQGVDTWWADHERDLKGEETNTVLSSVKMLD